MDDIWRFRQIHDHQFCPVCSVPTTPSTPPPAFCCFSSVSPTFARGSSIAPSTIGRLHRLFRSRKRMGYRPCHDEILERENIKRMRLEAATIRGTPNFGHLIIRSWWMTNGG
ncbi:hypothetical protein HPP92_021418 [Vanilla planifolia]|uniref:Uncharacterized protein n=1 Tax=Vanilla planifolia TaxID=51239 RepID=A0A835Q7Y9_VANPL|nr:hypothetical protein HPP92_021418 [Vanilla planifolia]